MSLFNIYNRMTSTPWLITAEALETIISIAERTNEKPEAVAAKLGKELDNSYAAEQRGSTAIIPVNGPLLRHANLFTMISGATSYDLLARDFQAALDNPAIESILLNIDSPGGDVNGLSELAAMVYAARDKKKVVAYVGGTGASAAYWLASSASEIVISDTSMLGSIGTVFTLEKRDTPQGVQRFEIVSSQSPKKRPDITTDAGRSQIQQWADDLSAVFVETVARNRGVTVEKVLSEFGQGDMLVGARAISAGLADRIGSFEGVIAELNSQQMPSQMLPFAAGEVITTMETVTMTTGADNPAAQNQPQAVTLEHLQQHCATLLADIQAAAATSERERVMAILNCDAAATRPTLAKKLAGKAGM
jgi:ClpP class serine protease